MKPCVIWWKTTVVLLVIQKETFQGQHYINRYEFAAGLNACLQKLERLIISSEAVSREDLEIIQRLSREFQAELANLDNRVNNLEGRIAFLEDHQFSPTTKLVGNAIFGLSNVFGDFGRSDQTVLQYRANLNFVSSFSGRDVLLIGLFAGNVPSFRFDDENLDFSPTAFNLPGVEIPIPGTDLKGEISSAEGTLSSQFAANTNNSIQELTMGYSFPVGKKLNIALLSSLAPFQVYAPTLNPYLDDRDSGTGAISVFGEYNPLYTLVGGGTGAIFNYKIIDSIKLTAGYLADGLLVGNPNEGRGLFNGGYGALGQITWNVGMLRKDNIAFTLGFVADKIGIDCFFFFWFDN